MAKLTLSVDRSVVTRAKRYARQHGLSVSGIVEAYLAAVSGRHASAFGEMPPILKALRGSLKRANAEDYRSYLAAKYR
jgi:hypothetical protein